MKSAFKALLPFLTGALIIATAGFLIHLYRSTYLPGPDISPKIPRAQFSFSVILPKNTGPGSRTLLLRVVKTGSSFLSVSYWPVGRTVLQIPVVDFPPGKAPEGTKTPGRSQTIRLVLWDPGRYTLSFSDERTGEPIRSIPVYVAAPLGLYRNDLILLVILALAGYLSGRLASGSMPDALSALRARGTPILFSGRVLFTVFLLASILLIAFFGTASPPSGSSKQTVPARDGFHESEGRADAPRMRLKLHQALSGNPSGYLVLRHRLDSWLRFGQDLTMFEGAVAADSANPSFILAPDDGRYRLTVWKENQGSLVRTHHILRAIPVFPSFPALLFLGFSLFVGAFFLLALLKTKPGIPLSSAERAH